jgi:hypothetical protein
MKLIGRVVLKIVVVIFVISCSLYLIFAINRSRYLERQQESKYDRRLQHEFLSALQGDLASNLAEFKRDSARYFQAADGRHYQYSREMKHLATREDTIFNATADLNVLMRFCPRSSLFESLRASGKLHVINDKELVQKILMLYQDYIPALVKSIELYYHPVKSAPDDVFAALQNSTPGSNRFWQLLNDWDVATYRRVHTHTLNVIVGYCRRVIKISEEIINIISSKTKNLCHSQENQITSEKSPVAYYSRYSHLWQMPRNFKHMWAED